MLIFQTFILKQCLSGYVLHNSLLHLLLKNCDFLNKDISQGSVATCLGCGGIFTYEFVTNFLLSLTVKEFWKSVNIWWSYGQELGVLFFLTHSVDKIFPTCNLPYYKQTKIHTSCFEQKFSHIVSNGILNVSEWWNRVKQYMRDISRL